MITKISTQCFKCIKRMVYPLFFVSQFWKDYIILKNKKTAVKITAKKEGI